jgi:hypothetical protein
MGLQSKVLLILSLLFYNMFQIGMGWKSNMLLLSKHTSLQSMQQSKHNGLEFKLKKYAILGLTSLFFPIISFAADLDQIYSSSEGHFSFQHSSALIDSPKPLKTHKIESLLKSKDIKGYNIGVTVDPVKVEKITSFSSPNKVAERVLAIEQSKEGYINGKIISTSESIIKIDNIDIPIYDIEYVITSTRGENHYKVRATIYKKLLYVFTAQCKEESYSTLEDEINQTINSFRLI